jgi:glycosyltransferase involved in cell wall biosynthesis
MSAAKTILFVHQSAELYGSDRVLLSLVRGLDRSRFEPIVVLPEAGPLRDRLVDGGVECHVAQVGKVHRADLSPRRILPLLSAMRGAVRALEGLVRGRAVHLVHTNTLAVLGGALWARWRGVRHLWHVHEVIDSPWIARAGYPLLVRALADKVVCNSQYTRDWLVAHQSALGRITTVVWNGYDRRSVRSADAASEVRRQLGVADDAVLLGLVGRINATKGHHVLLEACEMLARDGVQGIEVLFLGSVYGSNHQFLEALRARIDRSPIAGRVRLHGFREDIEAVWDAIDIAVVPSTGSEAFGLVAVEAMAAAKPVVASDLGGLREVVESGVTGYLVAQSHPQALAEVLRKLVADPGARRAMGALGQRRQEQLFSLRAQQRAFETVYDALCNSGHGGQVATV